MGWKAESGRGITPSKDTALTGPSAAPSPPIQGEGYVGGGSCFQSGGHGGVAFCMSPSHLPAPTPTHNVDPTLLLTLKHPGNNMILDHMPVLKVNLGFGFLIQCLSLGDVLIH